MRFSWVFLGRAVSCAWALVPLACASRASSGENVGKTRAAITSPITVQLQAPAKVNVTAPVLLAANSISIGGGAKIGQAPSTSAPSIALGSSGFHAEPDAVLDDVWSRGPADLRDRVRVQGTLHAASVTTGNGTVVTGGTDRSPVFDPLTNIQWTVQWPQGAAANVNLEPSQTQTISPGAFGTVRIASRATLTLGSGTYYFASLDLEPQATILLNQDLGPVTIYVAGSVIHRGSFAAKGGGDPDLLLAALASSTVYVEAPFNGALLVPFGGIVLRQATHTGFFAAKDLSVDANAVVRYRAPNPLLGTAGLPLQRCASLIVPRSDLTGRVKEVTYQQDIARYCSMVGAGSCATSIAARTEVDLSTIAFSLLAEVVSPAKYLSVVLDRVRKERAAEDNPTLAAAICAGPDTDGDFVPDPQDSCPNTPPLTATLDNGCTDPTLPDAPSSTDVNTILSSGKVLIDQRCAGAQPLPSGVAGGFYYPSNPERGSYIVAGRVTNQPDGCAIWYEFDIQEFTLPAGPTSVPVRRYLVAFSPKEETTALVGLSRPVPTGFIQFDPLPTEPGTRGFLGSAGGKVKVHFRVRTMNGAGMRSDWSAWKVTTKQDCLELGFECQN